MEWSLAEPRPFAGRGAVVSRADGSSRARGSLWRRPRSRSDRGTEERGMYFILGVIYFILLITLGIISIRKGHWVMFIIGLFIPLFWLIGALLPSRERLRGY